MTVTFYTTAGAVKTSQTLTIQPNGYGLFNTKSLTNLALAFAGFAKVTQTGSGPLAAEWLEVNASGKQFYAFIAVPSTQYALNWACGNVRRITNAPTQHTTFKIVNVDTKSAKLTLKLFNPTTGNRR